MDVSKFTWLVPWTGLKYYAGIHSIPDPGTTSNYFYRMTAISHLGESFALGETIITHHAQTYYRSMEIPGPAGQFFYPLLKESFQADYYQVGNKIRLKLTTKNQSKLSHVDYYLERQNQGGPVFIQSIQEDEFYFKKWVPNDSGGEKLRVVYQNYFTPPSSGNFRYCFKAVPIPGAGNPTSMSCTNWISI